MMKALTDLDKVKIRQSFSAASVSYDGFADLQRRVALDLLRRLTAGVRGGIVLDVGCGTGYLTHLLPERLEYERLLAMDIALPMLQQARKKTLAASYFCADAESMPLLGESLAVIASNLALQWCQALPAVFADFYRMLERDGNLIFSTFGPQTLQELKGAWALVDDHVHVNEFYSPEQVERFLAAAGFRGITVESQVYQSRYPSVMALMQELKGIGAHNVTTGRNRNPTTRSQLQQMIAAYPVDEGGDITASYQIIFVTARKS